MHRDLNCCHTMPEKTFCQTIRQQSAPCSSLTRMQTWSKHASLKHRGNLLLCTRLKHAWWNPSGINQASLTCQNNDCAKKLNRRRFGVSSISIISHRKNSLTFCDLVQNATQIMFALMFPRCWQISRTWPWSLPHTCDGILKQIVESTSHAPHTLSRKNLWLPACTPKCRQKTNKCLATHVECQKNICKCTKTYPHNLKVLGTICLLSSNDQGIGSNNQERNPECNMPKHYLRVICGNTCRIENSFDT